MNLRRTLAALAASLALAAAAFAAPDVTDPLEPLRASLDRQDELSSKQQWDLLVTEARTKAKDGTPEALYLLGRALGNAAVAKRQKKDEDAFRRLLDESQRSFEDAKESGVVVFAPAYLGLARCARFRGDLDGAIGHLRQALKIAPAFKEAALDLAQVCAEKGLGADAEFVLLRQLELRPKDPDVRMFLGMIKLAKQRPEEAEKEFRSILETHPDHAPVRKLLGGALMSQRNWAEAAQHLEIYVRAVPKDEEAYRVLFLAKVKSKDREGAVRVLQAARREVPGTETAVWAAEAETAYVEDPVAFETADERTPEALIRKLDSTDPKVLAQALTDMRALRWPALPAGVYRLLAPSAAPPDVRRLAVRLIGDQNDVRTLTILEIIVFHAKEQDPDLGVRREAVQAIAKLPTPGIVPVLWRALDADDPEIREAAVQGIAAQTGTYFRERIEVPTPAADWPREREQYEQWWRTNKRASLAKRDADAALEKVFAPIQRGRKRLAEYALASLDDADPKTWRAGYDLFRSLSGQDFGATTGDPDGAERARIARQCRDWVAAQAANPAVPD